jgi:uncharacterized membrane protein YfhO
MKQPRRWRRWLFHRDVIPLTLLLACTVLFFYKTVVGNLIMAGLDVFTYFYPYKAYAAETIRNGSLPLWNSYLFMGVPFVANTQSAVLYPLNIPLYWLSVPKMVSCSAVLHLFLGGAFTYLFARRTLGLSQWGSLTSGLTLALGGFLGAQVEHPNQLSVLVWLPLLLFLFQRSYESRRAIYLVLTTLVVALQFLAGHTQSSYINLMALGCYALFLPLSEASSHDHTRQAISRAARPLARSLVLLALVVALGLCLASCQLLPTYELSTLSIRGEGLPYRQVVSFSLSPGELHRSLLPNLSDRVFSEYVAYVGFLPLLLATLGLLRGRSNPHRFFFAFLAVLGLLLALGVYNPVYYVLYRLVPGFSLFRVPARWLYLYVVGISLLAGLGSEELVSLSQPLARPRKWCALMGLALGIAVVCLVVLDPPPAMVILYWVTALGLGVLLLYVGLRRRRGTMFLALVTALLIGELFLASRSQAYNEATSSQAFSSMRTSVAHLLTDRSVYRSLSYSDGKFDPGDLREIQENLGWQLPEEAVYDYLVATKQKEILAPNLPLLYGIQSIDGYDGGVLPLSAYVEWQRLLLPESEVSIDGRLQGRISEIPEAWLLNLCNVKYILTDKTYDAWVDGAYYDLSHRAILGGSEPFELTVADLPSFPATALGVVSYLIDGQGVAQDAVVAVVTVTDDTGHSRSFELRAGTDTAEGRYAASSPQHSEARIVGHWRDDPSGNDYHTLLEWEEAFQPRQIRVQWVGETGQLRLRGLTLIDQRTGTHRALIVSSDGHYRLVHSGDVKIYENLDVHPRAFVVHESRYFDQEEQVLEAMQDDSFDPGQEVLLLGEEARLESSSGHFGDEVTLTSYEPERVIVEAHLGEPGYLVLTDAYYPGWRAILDGQPAEILRADYYFRAVPLPEGDHRVEFVYDPLSFRLGVALSGLSLIGLSGFVALTRSKNPLSAGRPS